MFRHVLSNLILILIAQAIGAAFTIQINSPFPVNRWATNNSFALVGPFSLNSYYVQLTVSGGFVLTLTGVTPGTHYQHLFAGNSLGIVAVISAGGMQIDWNDLTHAAIGRGDRPNLRLVPGVVRCVANRGGIADIQHPAVYTHEWDDGRNNTGSDHRVPSRVFFCRLSGSAKAPIRSLKMISWN